MARTLRPTPSAPEQRFIATPPPAPRGLVGRETLLGVLHAGLRAPSGARRWVLTGLDGIGKTTLAAEYVRRHGDAWEVVGWVDAGDPFSLADGLRRLGEALDVARWGKDDPVRVRSELRTHLAGRPGALLVLDGVTDAEAVLAELPDGEACAVLVTAATWPAGSPAPAPASEGEGEAEAPPREFAQLAVPRLTDEEGARLVLEEHAAQEGASMGGSDDDDAKALARALLGTPLALSIVARTPSLAEALAAAREVLSEFYEDPEDAQSAADAREAIEVAWFVAMRRLEQHPAIVVGHAALFADAPLLGPMMAPVAELFDDDGQAAIAAAARAGLVDIDDDDDADSDRNIERLRQHPAVRALTREKMNPEARDRAVTMGLLGACAGAGADLETKRREEVPDETWYTLAPHMLALAARADGVEVPMVTNLLAHTLHVGGVTFTAMKEPALAGMLLAEAVKVGERAFGETAGLVAIVRSHADSLATQARAVWGERRKPLAAAARQAYDRVMALLEAAGTGESAAAYHACMARGRFEQADYEQDEAIGWFRRALALAPELHDDDSVAPWVAAAEIAECHERRQRPAEQIAALREALALAAARADDDPGGPSLAYVARLHTDLAQALDKTGDPAGARAAIDEAIRAGNRSFQRPGEKVYADFYQASWRLWLLAGIAERQGEDATAAAAYLAAIEVKGFYASEKDREVGHLNEALADLLARRGQLDDAIEHYRNARRVYQVAREEEHEWVGQVAAKLGEALARRGDLDGAASAYGEAARCLADSAMGRPDSVAWAEWPLLTARMARLALDRGDVTAAREHLRDGTEWLERHGERRFVGAESTVKTARTLARMAALWREIGDLPAAWSLYELALAWSEPVLGEAHEVVAELRAALQRGRTTA